MARTNETFPACETCGADAGELCGKGCPSESARGANESPSSLAKAVEYLGAIGVAPGRYAFPSAKDDRWRLTEGQGLLELDALIGSTGMVLNSHYDRWEGIWSDNLPVWWSPSQRFAWALDRKTGNKREAFDGTPAEGVKALSRLACHATNGLPRGRKRITADLTTGAEVPA